MLLLVLAAVWTLAALAVLTLVWAEGARRAGPARETFEADDTDERAQVMGGRRELVVAGVVALLVLALELLL